jgi:hypothetical protein
MKCHMLRRRKDRQKTGERDKRVAKKSARQIAINIEKARLPREPGARDQPIRCASPPCYLGEIEE